VYDLNRHFSIPGTLGQNTATAFDKIQTPNPFSPGFGGGSGGGGGGGNADYFVRRGNRMLFSTPLLRRGCDLGILGEFVRFEILL
jgi:hypothetical protein